MKYIKLQGNASNLRLTARNEIGKQQTKPDTSTIYDFHPLLQSIRKSPCDSSTAHGQEHIHHHPAPRFT